MSRKPSSPGNTANVCKECTIGQDCCVNLTRLKLTPSEFTRLFAGESDRFVIHRKEPYYDISIKKGLLCPHWDEGCAVYEDRSIEAILFPYSIGRIAKGGSRVIATYHSRTRCPFKEELLLPEEEARKLIGRFLTEVYGAGCSFEIGRDTYLLRWKCRLAETANALLG